MKSIYISDRLHRQAKLKAVERGIPLNQLVADLVAQGMLAEEAPAPQLGEATASYVAYQPPIADQSSIDQPLSQLVRAGLLSTARDLAPSIALAHQAARRSSSPPPAEPPTAAHVREMYRRERERHPGAPSAGELLRQMREEER